MNKKFEIENEDITIDSLFESMPVAMALLDREGRHIAINKALASLSGLKPSQLIGTKVSDQSKESGENIIRDFKFFDEGKEVPDHEIKIGENIYYASVKAVRNSKGIAIGEMVALTDITKKKETERKLEEANEKLQYLANYDSLTSVLNARMFYEACDKLIILSKRKEKNFSVLFVDLDYFKSINDNYGHDAGDLILKEVTIIMKKTIRESDIIGRVGGEEFSIYLPDTDLNGANYVAEKLRLAIEMSNIYYKDNILKITASIGVASKSNHHKSILDIQRDADHAMYHAKKSGRNRVSSLNMPCYIEKEMAESINKYR